MIIGRNDWSEFVHEDGIQTAQDTQESNDADAAKCWQMLSILGMTRQAIAEIE